MIQCHWQEYGLEISVGFIYEANVLIHYLTNLNVIRSTIGSQNPSTFHHS